jgi:hypothetical protein
VVRKMVLADSEGVMVAVVMSVMMLRVSSSSSCRAAVGEAAEMDKLRGGGGPLRSFYKTRKMLIDQMDKHVWECYGSWFFEESPVAVVEFTFQFISQRKNMNIRHTQNPIISRLLRKLDDYKSPHSVSIYPPKESRVKTSQQAQNRRNGLSSGVERADVYLREYYSASVAECATHRPTSPTQPVHFHPSPPPLQGAQYSNDSH